MGLWVGQTISLFGSQITLLALPLTAIMTLKVTTFQLGLLSAIGFSPFLILSLFAGVWVDRIRRRPILIISNLASAFFLGSIPLAAALHTLTIEYLYLVAFFTGVSSVFFQIAYQAYIPSLIEHDELVEGNTKLEVSNSIATLAGPGVAGVLIQLITAPFAVLFDAISFLIAAGTLQIISKPEPAITQIKSGKNIWKEMGQGLHLLLKNPTLRAIAGCTSTANFFGSMIRALFALYVIQELNINPGLFGAILTVGSIGPLLGALLVKRITHYFGLGPTIVGFKLLGDLASLLIPLAGGPVILEVLMLMISQFIGGFSSPLYSVNAVSLRQAITPPELQGRINASSRFIIWSTIPLGSLISGALGQIVGLRLTLSLATIGIVFSFLWLYFSPVLKLKKRSALSEETTLLLS